MNTFVSFAQNFEDVILWRALRHVERGFYVDCGACDPVEHSVTKAFYDRGWSGINIEPSLAFAQKLRGQRPRDTNLNVAVYDRAGIATFYEFPETGLSTMIPVIAEDHVSSGFKVSEVKITAVTLADIFREYRGNLEIHFLKVDVEGAESAVLTGSDLRTYRPWVILVEATLPLQGNKLSHHEWEAILFDHDYEFVYFDGLNRFYVSIEHSELKQAFSCPPNVFDDFVQSGMIESARTRDAAITAASERDVAIQELTQQLNASHAEREAHARHLTELLVERDSQANNLGHVQRNVQAQLAEIAHYRAEIVRLHKHIEQALELCRELRWSSERWERANSEARQVLHQEMKAKDALLRSTSWRITAPLRKISTAARVTQRQAAEFLPLVVRNLGFVPNITQPIKEHHLEGRQGFASNKPIVNDRYSAWIKEHEGVETGIERDKRVKLPTISIVVALQSDGAMRIDGTIDSLLRQNSLGWELIIACIGSDPHPAQTTTAAIKWIACSTATRGGALRAAAELASGDFLMTLEPGDRLPEVGVEACAHFLRDNEAADIIYADEDVLKEGKRATPQLKPEWSPELLTTYNYFGRPTLVRRTLLLSIGSFDPDMDDACEWDLYLRLTQKYMHLVSTPHIRRLTKVLCHRHPSSNELFTPESVHSADFRLALTRYWLHQGIDARVTTQIDGTQHATWEVTVPPLVSVIIPNRNQADLLRRCLNGLETKTRYKHKEVIIVDNASSGPEIASLYAEARNSGVRIVQFDKTFNYSRACNLGAAIAQGDLFLFLNNDIEIVESEWLDELVRQALRPGVGVVGCRLVYPNGVLQHAGVVVGLHVCGLVFHKAPEHEWGPFGSPNVTRNWLGVMGACQMIRRDVFQLIGGFDEGCQIATSDVRLSLDAWRAGYRSVYAAMSKLVHHEGTSRGHKNPDSDTARTAAAIRALGIEDDPYFHPGLSATIPVPTLRLGADPSTAESLKSDTERLVGPVAGSESIDLCDDTAVALAAGRSRCTILWEPDSRPTMYGGLAGARLIIDLVRRRSDVRTRFPRALSEGSEGTFARWLKQEASDRFGMRTDSPQSLDDAFQLMLSGNARGLLLKGGELPEECPLMLLPPGRGLLVRKLFGAVVAGVLERESAWWLLLESAEDPAREVVRSWQLNEHWRLRFPDGITRFGRQRFALWLRQTLSLNTEWLDPTRWPLVLSGGEEIFHAYLARPDWMRRFPHALSDVAECESLLDFLLEPEAALPYSLRAFVANSPKSRLVREMADAKGIRSIPSSGSRDSGVVKRDLRSANDPLLESD